MINKNYDLLGEQLAESGLEMSILGIIAGVSAVTSIAGGVMGAKQASDNNAAAEENQEQQQKLQNEIAASTNEYNARAFEVDKLNYYAMRDYSYQTSVQNWQRGNEIQDYQHLGILKEYEKSINIGTQQYRLNTTAADQAISSEYDAADDMFLQQQFQQESNISSLKDVYTQAGFEQQNVLLQQKSGENVLKDALINKNLGLSEQNLNSLKIQNTLKDAYINKEFSLEEQNLQTQGVTNTLKDAFSEQGFNLRQQGLDLKISKNTKESGSASIQAQLQQLTSESAFAKQNLLVQNLINSGEAALGQAGKSSAKLQQSNSAALQRSLIELETQLTGKRRQAAIELAQLSAQSSFAAQGGAINVGRILAARESSINQAAINVGGIGVNVGRIEGASDSATNEAGIAMSGVGLNIGRLEAAGSSAEDQFGLVTGQVGLAAERIGANVANAERDAEFNNRVLTANIKSSIAQTRNNIQDIILQKSIADLNVQESTMIRPERLSYAPAPQMPPERNFIEPQKAIPGYVPQAPQQNVWAPLIQGIGNSASTVLSNRDAFGL